MPIEYWYDWDTFNQMREENGQDTPRCLYPSRVTDPINRDKANMLPIAVAKLNHIPGAVTSSRYVEERMEDMFANIFGNDPTIKRQTYGDHHVSIYHAHPAQVMVVLDKALNGYFASTAQTLQWGYAKH